MQSIEGKIKNIIFSSDSGFFVGLFKVRNTNDELLKDLLNKSVTVTGLIVDANTDDTYVLYGEYIKHERYGMQFQFQSFEKKIPEGKDALIEFLSSSLIKGCGEKTAKQIVDILGDNALELIKQNKDNLFLVPNMTNKRAENIYLSVLSYSKVDDMLLTLKNLGFSINEATKLVKIYQDKTLVFLEENLYYFKEYIPFAKLDNIFLVNHERYDTLRVTECTKESMERISQTSGDVYYFVDDIKEALKINFNLCMEESDMKEILNKLEEKDEIVIDDEKIYLQKYYQMEEDAVHILKRMKSYPSKRLVNLEEKLMYLEKTLGVKYNNDQKTAITRALTEPVSIISGGPGTGKTTIVNAITKLFIEIYKLSPIDIVSSIALIAPTGRAAKKLSLSTGLPAMTIHRYLKWNKDTNDFGVNETNKNRQKIIIVDETSMIDIYLFSSLLKGILESSQLVLVGDTFQLPSVGAGLVLHDIVKSQLFSYSSLETIYRQSDNSYIPILAKEIKEQELKEKFLEKKDDYNFLQCDHSHLKEMISILIERYLEKGMKVDDIQVLAPMYKGENGIDNLNVLLQELFNPKSDNKNEITYFDTIYRENDKVLQLVNNPDCNVYNGDIGYIISIKDKSGTKKSTEILIDFDGNQVIYQKDELQSIKHAYAMTIHKSQGSEFAHVIMPITKNYYKMLYNKLIYTGVSRAKKSLILIGEKEAFLMSIYNDYATNRKTSFCQKLVLAIDV